jgi:hypothetical protein
MKETFSFSDELRKARRALEERIATYSAEHPSMGYRKLCEAFNVSLGTLSAILRRRQKKRNASASSFVVRHENEGKNLATVVTVTGAASTEEKWRAIAHYYGTEDIVTGDDPAILRRVEYTVRELKNRSPSS